MNTKIIKQFFNKSRITDKQILIFKNNYLEIYEELEKLITDKIENIKNLIYLIVHDKELVKCATCGQELTFKQTMKRQKFCSYRCSNNDQELKDKRLLHMNERCLKEYGVDSYNKLKEINDKKRDTFRLHFSDDEEKNKLLNRRKETNLNRYGYEYAVQAEVIKDKLRYIAKEKDYDKRNEKSRKVFLEKYGFEHKQILNSYENILKLEDVEPLFRKDEFVGKQQLLKFKCNYCGREFLAKYDNGKLSRKCICRLMKGTSIEEQELINFCLGYFSDLEIRNRTLIYPYELDIVIHSLKLAIEFNGCYWHSVDQKKLGYHLRKTELCEKLGYRLIQIWENDWVNDSDKIKNRLIEIFENREDLTNIVLFDRDWHMVIDNVEIIPSKIEIIQFKGKLIKIEKTGYFKKL